MNPRRQFASLSCAVAMGMVAIPSAMAQGGDPATTHHGEFAVRADVVIGDTSAPASLQRPALAGADRLVAILRRADALAHPIGFATVVQRGTGVVPSAYTPGAPVTYGVTGALSYYAMEDDGRGGRRVGDGGGSVPFSVVVNGLDGPLELDGGPAVTAGERVTGEFRGHVVYNGECTFITRRPVPPIVPVTKERYLKLQILKVRADSTRHNAQYREQGATRTSDAAARWLRDRPKREADMRAQYNEVKKIDPSAAQQMLDAWKKEEAQAEAQMRASSVGTDARIQALEAQGNAGAAARVRDLQTKLDALTPAERKEQATIIVGYASEKLADATDADALPLVQPNTAFYERSLAPDVAQVIHVCLPGLQPGFEVQGHDWDSQRARDSALIRAQLDWGALEAMVRR